MKTSKLSLMLVIFSIMIQAQIVPPKTMEDFKKIMKMNKDNLGKELKQSKFVMEDEYDIGNFVEYEFVSDDDNVENDITILVINDKCEGVGTSNLSHKEYIAFYKELQAASYVLTHQKIQLTDNEFWRSDIWMSKDNAWKAYVSYYDGQYYIRVTTNKVNYGSREDKKTGKLFDPAITHYVRIKNSEGKGHLHKAGCSHETLKPEQDVMGIDISPGMLMIAYDDEGYDGNEWEITTNQSTLPSNWSNKIKSFEIENLAVKSSESYGNQFNQYLGARKPNRVQELENIYVDKGLKFVVFDKEDFKGNSKVFTGDNNDLGSWKGKIKSYMVEYANQ